MKNRITKEFMFVGEKKKIPGTTVRLQIWTHLPNPAELQAQLDLPSYVKGEK